MQQSNTESRTSHNLVAEAECHLAALGWEDLVRTFGPDLEASARQSGALQRRREVKSAHDLLRLILVYCVCDWSLRLVGAWFYLAGLGFLSDVAVLKRLQHSTTWLGQLVVTRLQQRQVQLSRQPGVRLRLRDATVISRPGSQGTDWRVHLSLDLGALCLSGIEVTDAHGAETLARFPAQAGEIVVADRGYAFAQGIGSLLATAACLLVRINWQNVPVVAVTSRSWRLGPWLHGVRHPQERQVWLATPQGRFRLRLMAWPLPPAEAQRARRRARQAARKKGHTPSPHTLCAAGFVLLLTNLPPAQWSCRQVAALYRVRWQIELVIKRLKSLWKLAALRAQEPRLVQTYLLGKLLAALLGEDLNQATAQQCPDWFTQVERPVSVWRLTQLWSEWLRHVIPGTISLARVLVCLPALDRYLCGPPRQRVQQLAAARLLWMHLFTC